NKTRTQQEVCNLFNAKYPDNPITQSTVSKIESKCRETGDVKDLQKPRRPKITQDKKIDIVLSMEENPQTTSTLVASENEVSQTTVLRILGERKLSSLQVSACARTQRRRPRPVTTILLNYDESFHVLSKRHIEAYCRYWSRTNPHWIIEAHTQHSQKLNVWAGIVANIIISPFFFEETLTGERYM
ncbi:hypothetical protein NQ318_015309, partial [Aromia moschata]